MIRKLFEFAILSSAAAITLYAQPAITAGGIFNAASYAYPGLPNAAIAQGSLFVVYGAGMGPGALATAALPLPTTLSGTSMTATVSGTTTKPLIVYTSAGQIAAVMPSNTPVGTGTLTVSYNGQTSATSPLTVVGSSFGIFSVNQGGSGPGIITNPAYAVAGLTTSANPGGVYIIWGTGLGPAISGDESNGIATLGTLPVQVLVGGATAAVSGYARSRCCGGVDQIAFVVPAGVTGCHVPVAVQIGNVVSNFVSMPIAATGSVCSDPATPSTTPVTTGGNVSIGSISLSRTSISLALPPPLGTSTSTTDSGSASFFRYSPVQYAQQANPLQIATFGACTVYTFRGTNQNFIDPTQPVNLDAGPSISVTGPNGTQTLTRSNGAYFGQLGGGVTGIPGSTSTPLYLTQGQYQINNGNGGADVGPFSTTLNIPAPLVWTNASSISTINRSAGQTVTWTGGDPAGNVEITGYSSAGSGNATVGAAFVCLQQQKAGSFTIPAAVLLTLPAGSASNGVPSGILGVGYSVEQSFTATGLDQAAVGASGLTLQTATYQ